MYPVSVMKSNCESIIKQYKHSLIRTSEAIRLLESMIYEAEKCEAIGMPYPYTEEQITMVIEEANRCGDEVKRCVALVMLLNNVFTPVNKN